METNITDIFDYESCFWDDLLKQVLSDMKGMNKTQMKSYLRAINGREMVKSLLHIDNNFESSIADDILDDDSIRLIRGRNILIIAARNRKKLKILLDDVVGKLCVRPMYSNTLNSKNDIVHIYTFDMNDKLDDNMSENYDKN